MKQVKRDCETSIAWYKLADLIARREREKALTVYRLLSYSLKDKAYSLQLEGDILWSFDDQGAIDRYKQAVFLYKKEKRWVDAVCVCEHLLLLEPDNIELEDVLLNLYINIGWEDKFKHCLDSLYKQLKLQQIEEDDVVNILKKLIDRSNEDGDSGKHEWVGNILRGQKEIMPTALLYRIKHLLL